jgi:hypothetical protein
MYETAHLEGGCITRKKSCYMQLLKTHKVRDIFPCQKTVANRIRWLSWNKGVAIHAGLVAGPALLIA